MMLLKLGNVKKHFTVKKSFRQKSFVVKAVDGINLQIEEGESLSLVGESGCGKTTLARMILKLLPVDGGQILFRNNDITRLSPTKMRYYRKYMQMVFQDPFSSLDPRFTIRNILKEGMVLIPEKFKTEQEKEARIEDLLKAVHLERDMLSRFPHEFSGGERQRIAIARALVLNPQLLILDEAVSSLDVLIQDQILSLLAELQRQFKLTYLFISHNLKVVKRVSTRIAVMYRGKIVECAPTQELLTNPLHPYTQELLLAAISYKVDQRRYTKEIPEGAALAEKTPGHFVMEED